MSEFRALRRLVEDALEQPVAEREAWLAQHCEGELFDRAMELVNAADDDGAFLKPIYTAPPQPTEGQLIGPYTLVRPLATGGMGTVFLATRESPHREVALKIMRSGIAGADATARFRFEVEVLATLSHPHIAPMYETGMHGELPWFAMEYLEGALSLTEFADARQLDVGERIELFLPACDAIHHGHTKGVLHRDIKPDNLLVDRKGRCKVIDFGIARATDADLGRTLTGEVLGTLAYMSPEHVAGERSGIDTRSDVYALGVVLYEVLTGQLPYAAGDTGPLETMSAIRETPPARSIALKGDLETIVFKCLEKNSARRYDSVAALADDLRRFLNLEVIAARAPSVVYQIRTFARRHRVVVGALVMVLVVSLGAAVVSGVWASRARDAAANEKRERLRANAAAAQSEIAAEAAVVAAREAQRLFDKVLDRTMNSLARDSKVVQNLAGGGAVATDMIRRAIEDLKVLEEIAPDNRKVAAQLVYSHIWLGEMLGGDVKVTNAGNEKAALAAYEEAYRRALAMSTDDETLALRGQALFKIARIEKSEAKLVEAVAILEPLVTKETAVVGAVRALAYAHESLAGWALRDRDDVKTAHKHLMRQRELFQGAARRWPDDEKRSQTDMARISTQLAGLAAASGDFKTARTRFAAAVEAWGALVKKYPDNLMTRTNHAKALMRLGRVASEMGDMDAAVDSLRASCKALREMRDSDPTSVFHVGGLCMARLWLGDALFTRALSGEGEQRTADFREARDSLREAWELAVEMERRDARLPVPIVHFKKYYDAAQRRVEDE